MSELIRQEGVQLEPEWKAQLAEQFNQEYMQKLKGFLVHERQLGKVIYPKGSEIFEAFNATPFSKVKVVLLGQDPYHGVGQAHGLCFSVPDGVKQPPSLQNIYKELEADLGIKPSRSGNLKAWADQGVLLLNAVLTVEQGLAASHKDRGWERFTDAAIDQLNAHRHNLVFILWGRYAQTKGQRIDRARHLVLESAHPSPFSATRFFGGHHFSKTNRFLEEKGIAPINWQL